MSLSSLFILQQHKTYSVYRLITRFLPLQTDYLKKFLCISVVFYIEKIKLKVPLIFQFHLPGPISSLKDCHEFDMCPSSSSLIFSKNVFVSMCTVFSWFSKCACTVLNFLHFFPIQYCSLELYRC